MDSNVSLQDNNGDAHPDTNSTPQELKRNLHGSIFQLKLLLLFTIKGLNDESIGDFQLASEMPDEGAKFGDLIFKFKKKTSDVWRCRYVQAKHTQTDVETLSGKKKAIGNSELLNTKDGPFSLLMYMQSYLEIKEKTTKHESKSQIHDLVIVTNKNLSEGKQFKLEQLETSNENILAFDDSLRIGEKAARHRFTKWPEDLTTNLRNPDMSALAQKLNEYGHNPTTNTIGKDLNKKVPILNKYRCALILSNTNKNGILKKFEDKPNSFRFTENFVNDERLTGGAKTLRHMIIVQETRGSAEKLRSMYFTVGSQSKFFSDISDLMTNLPEDESEETINDFFEKLVFAVNTPNENELDDVLDAELRKYYDFFDVEFHSAYIFRKMLDWLKKKESIFLSKEEAMKWLEEAESKMCSVIKNRMKIGAKSALKTDVLVEEKFTTAPGPFRKDGYPNMKYKGNRDWADRNGLRDVLLHNKDATTD